MQATGGDDCQVEVFDSSNFNSNGMVSGLVGSIVSVRVGQEAEGSSITALAWHPSGLILAGTNLGKVDAFEVAQPEPDNLGASLSADLGKTFLIKRDVGMPRQQQSNNTVIFFSYINCELPSCVLCPYRSSSLVPPTLMFKEC